MLVYLPKGILPSSLLKNFVARLSLLLRPGPEEWSCPEKNCRSKNIISNGSDKRKNIPRVKKLICKDCGRHFVDRANTPYYWKHYPALILLTSYDLFHNAVMSFRHICRELPPVPRRPHYRTLIRWHSQLGHLIHPLKKFPFQKTGGVGDLWIADETYLSLAGKRIYKHCLIDSKTRAVLSSVFTRRKRALESEALLSWGEENAGRLPSTLVSDGTSAIPLAMRNIGWDKKVRHEIVYHDREFVNSKGYHTNRLERYWGTFQEWYCNRVFRGFKQWETTKLYCDVHEVFYHYLRHHSALNGKTPSMVMGLPFRCDWHSLLRWALALSKPPPRGTGEEAQDGIRPRPNPIFRTTLEVLDSLPVTSPISSTL